MTGENLKPSLHDNMDMFKRIFDGDESMKIRPFHDPETNLVSGCFIYFKGMVNNIMLNNNIIRPVLSYNSSHEGEPLSPQIIMDRILDVGDVELTEDMDSILGSLIYGYTLLLIDGCKEALVIGTVGWENRGVNEPDSERNVTGPREGFSESLVINLSLVRRRIKSPDLKLKFLQVGEKTNTKVCICYIEGVASEKILTELMQRIEKIKNDDILDSGYIQEMIKDTPVSPFETVGNTERPDTVAGKLLEGRIAVFVDGSPFVLTVPFLFVEYFQVSEDYFNNYVFSSINRILRFVSAFLAISIPAVYVSLVAYHQEMIPTPLLLSISAARQAVPLPTVAEAFFMLLVFEILREAGTRMPAPIGQAVSIVGALVLGQAAVDAKVVSAPMIIVVGFTGITALLSIKLQGASILVRFTLLILASVMGLYGYVFGILALVTHLMTMKSFGVSYMFTVGSFKEEDIKDTVVRMPWWQIKLRKPVSSAKQHIRKVLK